MKRKRHTIKSAIADFQLAADYLTWCALCTGYMPRKRGMDEVREILEREANKLRGRIKRVRRVRGTKRV